MSFYTSYFWQQEEEKRKALLLQEVLYKKHLPIIFGCVCTEKEENSKLENQKGSSRYFTEQLMDWFYYDALKVCKRGIEKEINSLEKSITEKLYTLETELVNYPQISYSGIFCLGNFFLLFYQGRQKVCFLNSRFLKPHIKWLQEEQNLSLEQKQKILVQGIMQKKTGILLATENFYQKIEEKNLKECLAVAEICQKMQMQKRLEELGQEGIRKGGENIGAIFLMKT